MAEKDKNSEAGFFEQDSGSRLSTNPLAIDEFPQLSPEQERALEIDTDKGVAQRLKEARSIGPSVRQQTQAEILNLVLLQRELGGNPFSVRRLPFSIMRDMAADPNIAFALYYIETPLINANWSIESSDAQLAAAIDIAFRPINSDFKTKTCNSLRMGYQPLIKRWKLGKLDGVYRDKNADDPNKDIEVWPSNNVDALLWKTFLALPPENCLPRWNEMGNFNGFMYSPVPIPNPIMLGVAQTYGPQILSGYPIPLENSIWKVNERSINFGCQPPDELVLTTDGYKPIGDLDPETDLLASYTLISNKIHRYDHVHGKKGCKFEKTVRSYNGDLIVINTGDEKIRVTPEHKFTVRWSLESNKYWAIYLMRRGNWWRIGTTRLHGQGKAANSGVGNRLQTEQAEEAWVIGVYRSRREAIFNEQIISHTYHIPDLTFEATGPKYSVERKIGKNDRMGNEELHKIWDSIDSRSGAINLLNDKGLLKDFPLYKRAIKGSRLTQAGWRNRWTIQAANMLPDLMEIPVAGEKRREDLLNKFWNLEDPIGALIKNNSIRLLTNIDRVDIGKLEFIINNPNGSKDKVKTVRTTRRGEKPLWKTFSISRENYSGPVVSLDVKPYHHYISNHIVTQNSLYGQPRTKRAYRFWWSFWYRWALADRSFENKADPAKIIYFPTEVAEALDADNTATETAYSLQQKAIQIGNNIRSGTTVAFPGDFMVSEDGKTMNQRKWEAKYMEGGENFSALEQNFMALAVQIIKACFLPEQAFVDATMAGQTSSQRYISAQMGEIYQESQQLLSNEDDEIVNKYMIPEFVAANFPDKVNIPCKKVTRGYGSRNSEMTKQLLTILGQKNPERIPVDIRALLREEGYPLNSESQQALIEKKHNEELENNKPPVMSPSKKEGLAGYNAGVEKTETGEHVYFQPGQELFMGIDSITGSAGLDARSFLNSLPKIPPYEDNTVRTAAIQMRKLFMDRYKNQITSLANQIRNKTILKLAQPEETTPSKPGLSAGAAKAAAGGAVAAWLSDQAVALPVVSLRLKEILSRIVGAAGRRELKLAQLDPSVYNPDVLKKWIDQYSDDSLKLMDHTTQDVFKDFLEKQLQDNSHPDIVAQELEDHFSDLPAAYSSRAVRAQTRDAYNKGMLQAGIDAGIDQVMAHDASDGTNLNTDKLCIDRNGRIFSLHDALKEKEHPNGTLHFSYLTTSNLSVEITDDIPDSLKLSDNMQAGYDENNETLYIRTSANGSKNKYLLALGERLSFR